MCPGVSRGSLVRLRDGSAASWGSCVQASLLGRGGLSRGNGWESRCVLSLHRQSEAACQLSAPFVGSSCPDDCPCPQQCCSHISPTLMALGLWHTEQRQRGDRPELQLWGRTWRRLEEARWESGEGFALEGRPPGPCIVPVLFIGVRVHLQTIGPLPPESLGAAWQDLVHGPASRLLGVGWFLWDGQRIGVS